jgi:ferrous iron transport protein A
MKTTKQDDGLITLSAVPPGGQAVVEALDGGHDFCARVANLGFTTGAQIQMVQNYGHGPVLVSVRGTLVALGRVEAERVHICALRVLPHSAAGGPWRHLHRPHWGRRRGKRTGQDTDD